MITRRFTKIKDHEIKEVNKNGLKESFFDGTKSIHSFEELILAMNTESGPGCKVWCGIEHKWKDFM